MKRFERKPRIKENIRVNTPVLIASACNAKNTQQQQKKLPQKCTYRELANNAE